jgi:hypothetical protein
MQYVAHKMRLLLIVGLTAGTVLSALAGGSAKWNPLLGRWEYTDDSGYNQGSSKWNPLFQQYDTYDSNGTHRGSMKWNPLFQRWDYGD